MSASQIPAVFAPAPVSKRSRYAGIPGPTNFNARTSFSPSATPPTLISPTKSKRSASPVEPVPTAAPFQLEDVLDSALIPAPQPADAFGDGGAAGRAFSRWDRIPIGTFRGRSANHRAFDHVQRANQGHLMHGGHHPHHAHHSNHHHHQHQTSGDVHGAASHISGSGSTGRGVRPPPPGAGIFRASTTKKLGKATAASATASPTSGSVADEDSLSIVEPLVALTSRNGKRAEKKRVAVKKE